MKLLVGKFPYVELSYTLGNTPEHLICAGCNSVFRKIVGADYFQRSER